MLQQAHQSLGAWVGGSSGGKQRNVRQRGKYKYNRLLKKNAILGRSRFKKFKKKHAELDFLPEAPLFQVRDPQKNVRGIVELPRTRSTVSLNFG